jgi:hypothetical protein
LKSRLEKNPRWQAFQTAVGQTRCSVQQTELAFLSPPAPKPKARFMNLGPQLTWAKHILRILAQPPEAVGQSVSAARLKEKLGWIEAFAGDLSDWSQWQQVVDAAVMLVDQQGVYRGVSAILAQRYLHLDALGDSARQLAGQLVEFVQSQECRTRPGERFPGSTEVLESCFGRFKHLEKQQSRGGFTQLLLGFGSLLARTTTATVRGAMQASRTADIRDWAKKMLGVTVFAQRKLAFAGATKVG